MSYGHLKHQSALVRGLHHSRGAKGHLYDGISGELAGPHLAPGDHELPAVPLIHRRPALLLHPGDPGDQAAQGFPSPHPTIPPVEAVEPRRARFGAAATPGEHRLGLSLPGHPPAELLLPDYWTTHS